MLTETPRIAAIVYVISYTCAFPAVSHHLPEKAQKRRSGQTKRKAVKYFSASFFLLDSYRLLHILAARERWVSCSCTSHAVQHINNACREWFHKSITFTAHIMPQSEMKLIYNRREQGHARPHTCPNKLQIHQIKFDKSLHNLAVFSNEDLRDQEKGQVQFKFKAKGSSFIPWHQGTRLYTAATMICQC